MRLLNVKSLKLEAFSGLKPPPYAILSHTWGAEEVSLQDFHLGNHQSKDGYLKIIAACNKAAENSFEYIWIDTCCIDQSSSVELSEAINSMFKYYQDAKICYAYLEDVKYMTQDEGETSRSIAASRWFTRGWTLQEFIAPRDVMFFSKDWGYLGSKIELAHWISNLTTIEESVLVDGAAVFQQASMAKRMSWAAERETTRPEDVAYCLLGIFGVHMPLLYGEGETKAFYRLQEEILKISMDHSLLAWFPVNGKLAGIKHRGALALHPREFKNAATFEPLPHYGYEDSVTERGLRVRLQVMQKGHNADGSGLFWGVLRCHEEPNPTGPLAIPLLHTPWDGEDTFIRHPFRHPEILNRQELMNTRNLICKLEAKKSLRLNKVEQNNIMIRPIIKLWRVLLEAYIKYKKSDPLVRTVFIPKRPQHPDVDRELFYFDFKTNHYEIVNAYPRNRWNSQHQTLQFKHAEFNSVFGAVVFVDRRFFFAFAIVVGMRLDTLTGEGRYFTKICPILPEDLGICNGAVWWRQKVEEFESGTTTKMSAQLTEGTRQLRTSIEEVSFMGKPILEVKLEERLAYLAILESKFSISEWDWVKIGKTALTILLLALYSLTFFGWVGVLHAGVIGLVAWKFFHFPFHRRESSILDGLRT